MKNILCGKELIKFFSPPPKKKNSSDDLYLSLSFFYGSTIPDFLSRQVVQVSNIG